MVEMIIQPYDRSPIDPMVASAARQELYQRECLRRILDPRTGPLYWLQHHTKTEDPHWVEAGATSPNRPFPDMPYFQPLIDQWLTEPIIFVEKSRDMMVSWLFIGLYTWVCQVRPGTEVLVQSQKEKKAWNLVGYARTLYKNQDPWLKKMFPLVTRLSSQSKDMIAWGNNSVMYGIPEGADQIRSHHPWALFGDEAAFQPKAGEAYNASISACEHITMVSSANQGWFCNVVTGIESIFGLQAIQDQMRIQ